MRSDSEQPESIVSEKDVRNDVGVNAKHWRVLHVLDHSVPLHSGYSFRTLAILREQAALGWETFHVTSPKQTGAQQAIETSEGLTFYRTLTRDGFFRRMPVLGEILLMRSLRKRLKEVIEQVKPDVLHVHSPVLNALPTLKVACHFRLPVVYEIRAFWEDAGADLGTSPEGSLRYRAIRYLETRAIKRAQAVTTICEGLRSDIVARGVAASKVTVIPNATDPERFIYAKPPNQDIMSQFNLKQGSVLGFAGSFYAYEGLSTLIGGLPRIVRAHPAVRVVLVGGGPEGKRLQKLVSTHGLNDVVHFTGRVPHDAVADYYSVMDVMVFPRISRRLTELVTPLKPLEAMAQGKLVVASDVGGHRELIRDGETGFLAKADDADALAEKIIEVLDNRSAWPAVQAAGRRFVESERNWQVSVARYKEVYANASAALSQRAG